jgi:prephenate dehydrogenase
VTLPLPLSAPKPGDPEGHWPGVIAVVGLGLLGASLCEAARRRHPGVTLLGISSPATIAQALAEGVIDEGGPYERIAEFIATADLVILCTPIDHILALLGDWATKPPTFKTGAIVTDVGSTKATICAAAKVAFSGTHSPAVFIGSHPMAGSERSGLKARDAHLFENACWIVCPEKEAPQDACEKLAHFLKTLGARLVELDPARHDAAVAHVSHLPQLLATALAAYVGGMQPLAESGLQIAGGGFRDMTRLAASSYDVWNPILRTNKTQVLQALAGYRDLLHSFENDLRRDSLAAGFAEGQALRSRLQTHRKGLTHALSEIVVDLEDKPGTLIAALKPLSDTGLNVLDCEILKIREGEEGVLMLAFADEQSAESAVALLHQSGLKARRR